MRHTRRLLRASIKLHFYAFPPRLLSKICYKKFSLERDERCKIDCRFYERPAKLESLLNFKTLAAFSRKKSLHAKQGKRAPRKIRN